MSASASPAIAVILPPNEGFGPGQSGAIGLIAARLARLPDFRSVVFCGPQRGAGYPGLDRRPMTPVGWLPGTVNLRYAARLAIPLRRMRPAIVEVHNRAGIALALSVLLRPTPVVLVLHNDPQAMRHARTPAERRRLLSRLAGVVTVSEYIRGRMLQWVESSPVAGDRGTGQGVAAGDPPGAQDVPGVAAGSPTDAAGVPGAAGAGPPRGAEGCPGLAGGYSATPDRPAAPWPIVIPNALDLGSIPAPAAMREKLVLFVGRTVTEKGPDLFVAACAAALPRLTGWRAELIGADRSREDSPDTPFVAALRTAARTAGVTLTGYRDHPQVLAAMSRAALVVVPSRWPEPFGLVALEAMACGAALICTRRGGLPEVAGDAALYLDREDPAALADAILALATDEVRRAALTQAGLARAAQFDLPIIGRRWTAMRGEVIARAG